MSPSDEIKQRLLETMVVLEEYTPKLAGINNSIDDFNSLVIKQKNLISEYIDEIKKQQESNLDVLESTKTKLINKIALEQKRSFSLFALFFLLISFVCGFFVSFHFSKKVYFSDHRLVMIRELESENLRIRKKYLSDIKLIETLRDGGCVISYDMLLAPEYIVKQSGNSKDGKFQGVWLKN